MRLVEEVDFTVSPDEVNVYKNSLEWAEKYLLRQGPLEYFVHHNTLHAFEPKPFIEALFKAKNLYRSRTHMPVEWFHRQFMAERITAKDLDYSIKRNFGPHFPFPQVFNWTGEQATFSAIEKREFLNNYIRDRISLKPEEETEFYQISTYWENTSSKFRTKKLKKSLEDLKFKFLSAFFDKGTAYWEMEDRKKGFLYCFKIFLEFLPSTKTNKKIQLAFEKLWPTDIYHSLEVFQQELKIPPKHFKNYLFQVLNESKGWTGLVLSLNENPNFNPTEITAPKNDYILFCITFELAGYLHLQEKREINSFIYEKRIDQLNQIDIFSTLYDELLKERNDHKAVQDIFRQNAEVLKKINYENIVKCWQEAYEAHLYFDLINNHFSTNEKEKQTPKLQVVTCIDDREESTRRHFEIYDRGIETFGYAGHFGLNIKYRSLREAHFRALCPVNANPGKFVFEEVLPGEKIDYKALASLKNFLFHNSNLPFVGSFLSLFLGPFTGMLFLFESLAPKFVHRMRKNLKEKMYPRVKTRLNYQQELNRGLEGFTDEELAQAAFALISVTGLNKNFGDVIYLCGHGSKSMNNPHGAAYNCGACAGGKGAPNARLMATALNKPSVRSILKERGIFVPEATTFVGGYHCTSTGKLLTFEDDGQSEEKVSFLKEACRYVEKHESKERMRKFENVSLNATPEEAFLAAQNRSYDFSQPRPEYGHNTNAFCLVGSRDTSEQLFLDRRAFLVSYEDSNDLQGDNLLNLLSAVIPVCAGINLEYYFSFVDQQGFGAGVKQAHNVTALMGVMNGYQSDLQMGLPWQMVEIHEPARITFLIEADQAKFEKVLERNKEVRNLVKNEWVLVILKTKDGRYLLYGPDEPTVLSPQRVENSKSVSSEKIYNGKREILNVTLMEGK